MGTISPQTHPKAYATLIDNSADFERLQHIANEKKKKNKKKKKKGNEDELIDITLNAGLTLRTRINEERGTNGEQHYIQTENGAPSKEDLEEVIHTSKTFTNAKLRMSDTFKDSQYNRPQYNINRNAKRYKTTV